MAISVDALFEYFNEKNIEFFTGVPDSLLKSISYYLSDNMNDKNHVIAANEGNAIALAAGYHIATKRLPMVYMQNSGFGNAMNPILSLAAEEIYLYQAQSITDITRRRKKRFWTTGTGTC